MLATLRSSTKTCGASRTNARGRSGYFPAKIIAIDPPSLMPQQYGPRDVQLVEQLRQHHFAFVMHESHRPLLQQPVGISQPVARINKYAAACPRREELRKVLPQRDRAQAFVQHDDRRAALIRRLDP